MRIVLIIISSLIMFTNVKGQDFSYKNISLDSCFKILDIDINRDGVKDKVAYNTNGNDLVFYVQNNNSYINVYHGDNYSMDGLYSIIQIQEYTENNNVLYIKNIFNGAGGQTIVYFISYINGEWQLSQSVINSSTASEIKICHIDYLVAEEEDCLYYKSEGFKLDDIITEIINTFKIEENENFISKEFIFYVLNTYPVSIKNVTLYNNLAFQLEQLAKNKESIYLLQKVLKKFPNRIVAYINLGDAYWGLEEKDKAKNAYQKYIELMKASGKKYKIPQKVFERIR